MKVFFDHEILSFWCYEKPSFVKSINQFAGSMNDLVWFFKKWEPQCEKRKTSSWSHVGCMKNAAR